MVGSAFWERRWIMEPNKLIADVDWVDDQAPGALVRFGFLGKSSQPERWRLYTHPDLSHYLEFAGSEVLNVAAVSSAQSPLGGSVVWFKADAKFQRVSVRAVDEQTSFLKGPVTSGFLRRAQGFNIGGGSFSTETIVETIISFLAACPSYWIGCTAQCTVQCGVTLVGACPIYTLACTYEKRICG
jgi:hypothetical protein